MNSAVVGYVCIIFTGLLPCISALGRPSSMVLENNQYKNMVIAIHESVTEDKKLIETLKDTMTNASKYLFNATHSRAYFKEITILLPHTWSHDPSYGAVTSETVNMADVIITSTVRKKRSLPQARSYRGCGKQGVHVLLPVEFLTSPRAEPFYADPAKYFIHTFAQFRWGVFQEYAEAGENLYYFSLFSGHPEAVRCTMGIRGLVRKNDATHSICYTAAIDKETGVYTPDCKWLPYPTHQRVKASIMNHQWIQAIETFCNDDPKNYATMHNTEAPSKHNRLCNHRSTWDVISNTDDFSNGKNAAVASIGLSSLEPNFKVVRAAARRKRALVVVDDQLHGSTIDADQMINRIQHETSHRDIELTSVLESQHLSRNAQDSLPEGAFSSNDRIIFVKHGCDNSSLQQDDAMSASTHVIYTRDTRCVQDHFGALSNNAVEGMSAGHTLCDRLRDTILKDHVINNKYIMIQREDIQLSPGDKFTYSVHLDPTVGRSTLFIFHYETSTPEVIVQSPLGNVFTTDSPQCYVDQKAKLVKFFIADAERGQWKYVIKSKLSKGVASQLISIIVSSTPTKLDEDPVVVRTLVEPVTSDSNHVVLHVDVTQGSRPVTGLNVTAKVELPSGQTETINLYDNGAGADTTKNDGIYSRYFTKSHYPGSYHVTASVRGRHGEVFATEESYLMPENQLKDTGLDDPPAQRIITKRSVDGNIQRHVVMGSVHVASPSRDLHVDTTPPSRVVDLKVVRHLGYRNTLVLTWTAPGDDLDHGKVEKYDVVVGENVRDVMTLLHFGKSKNKGPGQITVVKHKASAIATEQETFLWTIPPSTRMVAFAVRGVDAAGNKAELSNVATFGFVNKFLSRP